jgi:hypothetical protein
MWPVALALGLVVAGVLLLVANRRAAREAPREARRGAMRESPGDRGGKPKARQAALATPSMLKKAAAEDAKRPVAPKPAAPARGAAAPREKPVAARPAKAPAAAAPPAPAAGPKQEKVDRLVEAVKAEFEQLLKAKLDPNRPESGASGTE